MQKLISILIFLSVSLIAGAQDDIVGTWTTTDNQKGVTVSEIKIRQRPDSTYQIKVTYTPTNYCEPSKVQVISNVMLKNNSFSWEGYHDIEYGYYHERNGDVYEDYRNGAPSRKICAVSNYDYRRQYYTANVYDYYHKYTCRFSDGVLSLSTQIFYDFKRDGKLEFRGIESWGGAITYTDW